MADTESELLSVTDIARLAGVRPAQVSTWRKRNADFPPATAEPASGPVFGRDEVAAWLEKRRPAKAKTVQPLGFEAKLWQAADALRNNMDAAEYKHVVLGVIFLKYISDSFEERRAEVIAAGDDPEDRDYYAAENVFWVPQIARWSFLRDQAKQPNIGKLLDDAMEVVESDNPRLKGVLPRDYARPTLDWQSLGRLIDLFADVGVGGKEARDRDVLGRVYEYFLGRFASAEGKAGGQFYTPQHIVRLLVEMIEPFDGRVYDPCCGSGGMFVQSVRFLEAHGGRRSRLSIYGQESNPTTWKLCQMNLAIRGIDGNLGPENADSFHRDQHRDLRADFILANPPFNSSDWKGGLLREDVRWKFGVPPVGNANYAWIQHFIHHLAPHGIAGFVMANGSLSTQQSGEGEIRKAMIEADLVDCIVALPGQLFYSTQIPVCLWFVAKDRSAAGGFRDRRGEILFIDARAMGQLVTRVHRVLTDEEIARIALTYHAWRGEPEAGDYNDINGFCRSVGFDETVTQQSVLTPGRYVGSDAAEPLAAQSILDLVNAVRLHVTEGSRASTRVLAALDRL